VLEYSRAFLTNGAGRLLRVDGVRGTSLVLADPLQNPTSLALDTRTGDLFVIERRANRIVRVLVPK
jgi:sugar lactone lactonase YvrE